MGLGQDGQLRLEHAGRSGDVDREVDHRRLAQRRPVHGAEQRRGDQVGTKVEQIERGAHSRHHIRIGAGFRQPVWLETVGVGLDLDVVATSVGADGTIIVQEGPLITDLAPAEMAVDCVSRDSTAQHLDGGAQMVLLSLPGEDHRRRAPDLGDPRHGKVALRRHLDARQRPAVGHLAFDRQDGPLPGAVVMHLLGHDPGAEVAERRRHRSVAGLLPPGDHAARSDEVRTGLDDRLEARAVFAALDHMQAHATQLALQVAQSDAGLLQVLPGPLEERRIRSAEVRELFQGLALEGRAGIALGALDQKLDDRRIGRFILRRPIVAASRHVDWRGQDRGAHRLDPVAKQDIEPVDVLAWGSRQGYADLEALMVFQGKGMRRLLAGAVAAIIRRTGFVAVSGHRNPLYTRPGDEHSDAAGRQGRGDSHLACVDLGPVRDREGG